MKNFIAGLCAIFSLSACGQTPEKNTGNAGLTLPPGFSARELYTGLSRPRHLAVEDNKLYVKLEKKQEGAGILVFDLENSARKEPVQRFGDYTGTGIFIRNKSLFASSDEAVYRYPLGKNGLVLHTDRPELVVKGLWNKRQHASKSIVVDMENNLYINVGAPSNSCQVKDRQNESPGQMPCPILDSAGGIWQFNAMGTQQGYAQGRRFATGLRNVVGLDWNTGDNSLYVTQHGRDQLAQNWSALYTNEEGANNPAETMYRIKAGDNAGWPYAYYHYDRKELILAPEYGGDGKKGSDQQYLKPQMAFPAHMAPNGLLFYTGNKFPARYREGAFIAFHGSWNRSPLPQEGYYVVFVPFRNGAPFGEWEVFADGFAGAKKTPGGAEHRPCGLAQDEAGNLYISDDSGGVIYQISYLK